MEMKKILIVVCCLLIPLGSCGDGGGDEVEEILDVPILLHSTPEDGATDVDLTIDAVELVFDAEIALVSKSRILINDAESTDVFVSENTLTVGLPTLVSETAYTVTLEKMAIKAVGGAVNSEEISISFITEESVVEPDNELVTESPTSQAVKMYDFLKENYGSKILSATQSNVNWNINEAEWVYYHTGKYPAMATFDYIHLSSSPADWIDYSDIDFVKEWWNNNGIIGASWHWLVPPSESETDPLKYTYKNETAFKPSNVVIDGTWENTLAKADLDKLIGYIKLLQDEDIPMLWRPLHEAAGNIYAYTGGEAWFWWGSEGAEAYKALWHFVFDYFEDNGIHNLIWVWTTQTNDDAFYPGDDYVDIIGRDIYDNAVAADIAAQFQDIQNQYPDKMVTLSECGNVANISAQWSAGAEWSWFMPWYDYDRTNDINGSAFTDTSHAYANIDWWQDALAQEEVITRDEMPSLK
jgi:mannan endo-1,4-beta-mannosidase